MKLLDNERFQRHRAIELAGGLYTPAPRRRRRYSAARVGRVRRWTYASSTPRRELAERAVEAEVSFGSLLCRTVKGDAVSVCAHREGREELCFAIRQAGAAIWDLVPGTTIFGGVCESVGPAGTSSRG